MRVTTAACDNSALLLPYTGRRRDRRRHSSYATCLEAVLALDSQPRNEDNCFSLGSFRDECFHLKSFIVPFFLAGFGLFVGFFFHKLGAAQQPKKIRKNERKKDRQTDNQTNRDG